MVDAWNVEQYERFKIERAEPFHDLLKLIEPAPAMRIVDLGCGTGELTAKLHEHFDALATLGIDNSPAMLKKASKFARENLAFVTGDIASFEEPEGFDLLFSNAALQWIPNHSSLIARLSKSVRLGGQIAIQVPRNQSHPAQVAARDLAQEEPYREFMGVRDSLTVLEPKEYALLLHSHGFERIHVRLQVYLHLLDSREEVFEWSKGTLLTEAKRCLPEELFDQFLTDYRTRLLTVLEDIKPYPYTFERVLMRARKSVPSAQMS